ncbi:MULTISPECIES: hypothetical protein [Burkholderia]|uniref:hypothetical protein n=1 Tax=Burkholderia TaxID=32008 RepID=UPI00158C925B|nr:hypothetical protein [Burkholderia ambifaria]
MRTSIYVCLAAIATVLAGCLWVYPATATVVIETGGMAARMAVVTKVDGIEATRPAIT